MAGLAVLMKLLEDKARLVASVLPLLENLNEDKRVESTLFPRLDEGSIPSCSTSECIRCHSHHTKAEAATSWCFRFFHNHFE